ncbi:MAG: SRPBCC domain-containing protein [Ancalomicrobiaceae bacterium]|nr:SRPBCC domain-containing protein [Ancalomicrobiaceae bacterium]
MNRPAKDAFAAINNPRAWWGVEIAGETSHLGDEWTYRYKDFHTSKQRVSELVPNRRVVWDVVEANLTFIADGGVWTGTRIVFDLTETDGATEIRFAHEGLGPDCECFDACSGAWTGLVSRSLKSLIETGHAFPDQVG